jgi:hypothetical protein
MALEGSLRDFDLFSLFNMIKTQGKSGTLVLSRAQEFVKVFFDQGEVVGCDSNQVPMEDRLGALLVRLGRLSGEELIVMIQQQRQTAKRMGTLLLESGKVTRQDLQDALFNQAMSIIYRTFRWVEGDYRFDSIVPMELDRENFPPIPVDTVLMEAARIMDEWPEVQRRLPDSKIPLVKTVVAENLQLGIDQNVSLVLDGGGQVHTQGSGLTHEQEVALTYFNVPASLQEVLQISRYDELETCKIIADLLDLKLLEPSPDAKEPRQPSWSVPLEMERQAAQPPGPSGLFWPLVAVLLAVPLLTYVRQAPGTLNQELASLHPGALAKAADRDLNERQAWSLRLAEPKDQGRALAKSLGLELDASLQAPPDFSAQPDPLAGIQAGS